MIAVTAPPAGITLEPALIRVHLRRLNQHLSEHPRAAAERMAAAEAYLRMALLDKDSSEDARLHLERAAILDPYRAEVYLVLGVHHQRAGELSTALAHYDRAVILAPRDTDIRFHRAYALLEASRSLLESGRARESPLFADAAVDDFEWLTGQDSSNRAAVIGAIESCFYCKAKKRRGLIGSLLRALEPGVDDLPTAVRLLYQAIFAFGVGKRKTDKLNSKVMQEIVEVAQRWLDVYPQDSGLRGVISAATAKLATPDALCGAIDQYVAEIADVRIVRLLVRERLADVEDPVERLSLFESAMKRIPALDGISQDYLQLLHLVAKRAAAVDDLEKAETYWRVCLDSDPDNPAAINNLMMIAASQGVTNREQELAERRAELWSIYARFSPRCDLVLRWAGAWFAAEYRMRVDALEAAGKDAELNAAILIELAAQLMRSQALARLAVDAVTRANTDPQIVQRLIDPRIDNNDVFEQALEVVQQAPPKAIPVVYAYLDASKDTPIDILESKREELVTRYQEIRESAESANWAIKRADKLLRDIEGQTRVLFEPDQRANYDRDTCDLAIAEHLRQQHKDWGALVALAADISDSNTAVRLKLAKRLQLMKTSNMTEYFTTSMHDEENREQECYEVAFGSVMEQAIEQLTTDNSFRASALLGPWADEANGYFNFQRIYAYAVLQDTSKPSRDCARLAQHHAQQAIAIAGSRVPHEVMEQLNKDILSLSVEQLAQEQAVARARRKLENDNSPGALAALWGGYPLEEGDDRAQWVGPEDWSSIPRLGCSAYAFWIAQTLRADSIRWYNEQKFYDPNEHQEAIHRVLLALQTVDRWARHARSTMAHEKLGDDERSNLRQAIQDLQSKLEEDEATLRR